MLPAMSGLAVAAAAQPDWLARGIAIAGVLIATVSVLSTRHLWHRQGPLLAFDLVVIAFRQPGTETVHRIKARIEVANVGRMAASVRAVELRGSWSPSFVLTDVTADGFPELQPTEFLVSDGIDFAAPDDTVRNALKRPPPADPFAEEILKTMRTRDETLVRGRVSRGDGHTFSSPRKTIVLYRDESWPGSKPEE
jgi:hypothetical protein